jgi:endoglucanase
MRGVNLGNYLEYAVGHGARNASYSAQDFSLIRSEGFDHVRLPVAWHLYTGAATNYPISSTIFTQADALVSQARNAGLGVIVDLHHFDAFNTNPSANAPKFYAIWRQVAAHYATAPETVAFELLNEPNGAATTSVLNPIYAETIRQIRQTNPNRTIFVGPSQYNSIDELSRFSLPADERNLILTVHLYDPYYFTHQGAEWALPDTGTTGVIFPGPPAQALKVFAGVDPTHTWVHDWFRDYNTKPTASNPSSPYAFRSKLARARSYAATAGRPVHVGEFGCYAKFADATSRANFYREARRVMDEYELGWAMWDWKSGFHYIKDGRPDPPGLREALFPPIELRVSGKGGVEFSAAKGKTLVVERTPSLASPVAWQTISTQTLTSPKFLFQDLEADGRATSFYRVRWVK